MNVKRLFFCAKMPGINFHFHFQEQQRLCNRRQTDQHQQLFQLRSIKTSIKQVEETTKARQKQRKDKQEAQKAQPRRLGKLKYVSSSLLPPSVTITQILKSIKTDRTNQLPLFQILFVMKGIFFWNGDTAANCRRWSQIAFGLVKHWSNSHTQNN